jgi:Na+-transporting NADH:ubiquinone oxidoreductase subunit NqrF
MGEIFISVAMFTGIILFLVGLILVARSKLVATGPIKLNY